MQSLAFFGEDFELAAGFGFELGIDGGGLALGLDPPLGGLGGGIDLDLGLVGLGGRLQGGPALGFDALGLGQGGLGSGDMFRLQHGGLGLHLAGLAYLVGLGLLYLQGGLRSGHVGPGQVLAFHRPGVGIGQFDAHLALGVLDWLCF